MEMVLKKMNDKVREIKGSDYGDPVRVKLTGGRYFFIALGTLLIWLAMLDISMNISQSNKLRERDLEIKKEQLELQRRQYQLDSLRYETQSHKR